MVLRCTLLLAALIPTLAAASDLPRVMSTNLCADMLLLSLADPAQVVSVSARSQDPARTSFASQASVFPANTGSAEEVIAARPDIVLASRRWSARHQTALLERHGIAIITVPFPTDWPGIVRSTDAAQLLPISPCGCCRMCVLPAYRPVHDMPTNAPLLISTRGRSPLGMLNNWHAHGKRTACPWNLLSVPKLKGVILYGAKNFYIIK